MPNQKIKNLLLQVLILVVKKLQRLYNLKIFMEFNFIQKKVAKNGIQIIKNFLSQIKEQVNEIYVQFTYQSNFL